MKDLFSSCMRRLDQGVQEYPWTQREAYADWLAQTFYYVSHSTRLLATAAGRFPRDASGNALHQRFAKHIAEEDRHELLAEHDIGALGLTLARFPERDSTRMFYETQYYKVEHQDPIVLFGYILPLEAVAVSRGRWVLEQIEPQYGRAAGTFLRVHAQDDVDHLDKAFAALQGLSGTQSALANATCGRVPLPTSACCASCERSTTVAISA